MRSDNGPEFVSQASHSIKGLEPRLAVRLLHRTTRRVC
jgi:DNA-binding transcriptional LysR family regulator